jgi:hypothetical protein
VLGFTYSNPIGLGWCIAKCHAQATFDKALCLVDSLFVKNNLNFAKHCVQGVNELEVLCVSGCYSDYGRVDPHKTREDTEAQ